MAARDRNGGIAAWRKLAFLAVAASALGVGGPVAAQASAQEAAAFDGICAFFQETGPSFALEFAGLGADDAERSLLLRMPCDDASGDRVEIERSLPRDAGDGIIGSAMLNGGISVALPSGRTLDLAYSERSFGPLRQGLLTATLSKDGRAVATAASQADAVHDPRRPGCASTSGVGEMGPGLLEVGYPEDVQVSEDLFSLALDHSWVIGDGRELSSGGDLLPLDCQPERSPSCLTGVDVGPGMELAAIAEINAINGDLCAIWLGDFVGVPFDTRRLDLPHGTLLDPPEADLLGVAERLDAALASFFPAAVRLSGLGQTEVGYSFATTVVGPSSALGLGGPSGLWYAIELGIDVDQQMNRSGLFEALDLTLLSVFEIRATETLAELPVEVLKEGRLLSLYTETKPIEGSLLVATGGELTEGGRRFARWQEDVARRLAVTFGGQLRDSL
jgi:hypothetical protein